MLSFLSNYLAHVPNAAYQAQEPLALWFRRRRFLKGCYHIWVCLPSLSCDPNATNKLSLPTPLWFHMTFGFDWQVVSEEKTFEQFSLYELM